jgi:endonuclease YncB( thermonuclease family)
MPQKRFSLKGLLSLYLLAVFTICSFASLSFAREPIRTVSGTVTKVSDGDTIQVTTPKKTKVRVRLYGIDAPEMPKINQRTGRISKQGQPYGQKARKVLEAKILGKQVRMDIIEIDKYKRMAAVIWIGKRNINREMIQDGYAEAYVEHLKEPYRSQFVQAQKEARSERKGMWWLPGYERPKDFRKRMKIRG